LDRIPAEATRETAERLSAASTKSHSGEHQTHLLMPRFSPLRSIFGVFRDTNRSIWTDWRTIFKGPREKRNPLLFKYGAITIFAWVVTRFAEEAWPVLIWDKARRERVEKRKKEKRTKALEAATNRPLSSDEKLRQSRIAYLSRLEQQQQQQNKNGRVNHDETSRSCQPSSNVPSS
jgi:hypothetical protein